MTSSVKLKNELFHQDIFNNYSKSSQMKSAIILILLMITSFGFGQLQKSKTELKGDKLYFIFAYNEAITDANLKICTDSEGLHCRKQAHVLLADLFYPILDTIMVDLRISKIML